MSVQSPGKLNMITNERLIQIIELLKSNTEPKAEASGSENLRPGEMLQIAHELLVSRYFGVDVPGFNGPGT